MSLRAAALTTAVVLSTASSALAQSGVQLSTQVSQRTVEQGDSFQFQITAMTGAGEPAPSSPRLPAPPGATVHGPSVSSQQHVQISGGTIERRQGFTATWSVTPTRLGKLRIGPASVLVGSKQVQSEAVVIDVVPAGQAPSQRSRRPRGLFGNDPFDMFRRRGSLFPPGMFDDPFQDPFQDEPQQQLPQYPPEYALSKAPDPIAFVRSTTDKKSVVVGEQLTFKVYVYGSRGPFEPRGLNEPAAADFVSFPVEEDRTELREYPVDIGDQIWHAAKLRELALFPLKTGKLPLGPMRVSLSGRGYGGRGNQPGLVRQGETLSINVTEPPLAGRPAGYRIGDVGSYRLDAQVEPKSIQQGDAVSVSVTLKGTGNLPLKLDIPQRVGVEWLEPQVRGDVGPQNSIVQGERQFQYVVRVRKAGTIDLGEIRLPYWDPAKRSYFTATARLGSIKVTASKNAPTDQQTESAQPDTKLSRALSLRKTLGPDPISETPPTDTPWFWALLALGPALVAVSETTRRASKGFRKRLAVRRNDGMSLAHRALAEAEKSLGSGDAPGAISAAERAVFHAIEAVTGLKGRGVLRQELGQKLEETGVPANLASGLEELLGQCETARFTGGDESQAASDIVNQTRDRLKELGRLRRSIKRAPRT